MFVESHVGAGCVSVSATVFSIKNGKSSRCSYSWSVVIANRLRFSQFSFSFPLNSQHSYCNRFLTVHHAPCSLSSSLFLPMQRIIFRPNLDGLKIVVNFDVHAISQRVLHAPHCAPAKLSCSLETITCVRLVLVPSHHHILLISSRNRLASLCVCAPCPCTPNDFRLMHAMNAGCSYTEFGIMSHICSGANGERRHNVGHIVEHQHRE